MASVKSLIAIAALAGLATAETIKVTATSKNTFDPDAITAKDGDVIEFHFEARNHSVAAGSYQYPCTPLNMDSKSTFFSAFVAVDSGEAASASLPDRVFRVIINGTEPVPFYSTQGNECAKGMVGIINENANVTLGDYKKRASVLSEGVTPRTTPFGGEFADSEHGSSGAGPGSGSGASPKPTASGGHDGGDGKESSAGFVSVGTFVAGLLGVGFAIVWTALV